MASRRRRVASLFALGLLVAATWACESVALSRFETSEPGTSAGYWKRLCGVELPGGHPAAPYTRFDGTLPSLDGVAYYYDQLHHFQVLYAVPETEVLRGAAAARDALAETAPEAVPQLREDPRPACRAAFAELAGAAPATPDQLGALRRAIVHGDDPGEAEALAHRVALGRRAGVIALGEGLYLSAWWSFVFLGALAPRRRLSWRWRVGLGPFLLLVPFFLGYAPMSLSSGPGGGFVYPGYVELAAVALVPIPCTAADSFVWRLLPHPLFAWSLLPGRALATSFRTCAGPVQALVGGLALVAAFSAAGFCRRRLRR